MNITLPAISTGHLLWWGILFGLGYLVARWDPFGLHTAVAALETTAAAIQGAANMVKLGIHTITKLEDGSLQITSPLPAPPPKVTTVAPS